MNATEQLRLYRARHVIAMVEVPFSGKHRHLIGGTANFMAQGAYAEGPEHSHDALGSTGDGHVHSVTPTCKVDGIRLVRGGSLKPWRHDPDEIKRLVKEAAEEANLRTNGRSGNVTAMIEAHRVTELELSTYAGPYRDGMYATGMLQELLKQGYVVVPQQRWAAFLEADNRG